ncbi:MAG: cupin domain-containing protein [Chloroflexi bacterium]|nr:cupin domain-containing protein [Chloroflexota bacterium]
MISQDETSPASSATGTQSLGEKIRHYRKQNRLKLVELAEQCGISPSFLSQIERDQANPSVTTLYSLADGLHVSIAKFFTDAEAANSVNQQVAVNTAQVVPADRRKILIYPGTGIRNELLSPDLQRAIQMMRIVMPPGTDSGDTPFVHQGEECGIVLQGQLETLVGDERYVLGPGDTIYHDSTIPHRSRNIGDTDVIIIVAKTPPSF